MKKTLAILGCLVALLMTSCKDEVTSIYSTKYKVRCGFTVVSYPELVNCIDNLGQFSTIRQSGSNIIMKSAVSTTSYAMDAISKEFFFGLSGLIVGTPTISNDGSPYRAYDLGCPNCDRASYRLTVNDNGTARCSHCGIIYDLNDNGVILDKGESNFDSPRVLYRYNIIYNGIMIHINN